ncbi:helix-turn-helix domain-containing protein [Micromonospora sp. M12]
MSDVFARGCTSRAAFEDVTSKWASLVLLALGEGRYRFNALRRRVDGVSERMLSQTLQTLERDGMLTREVLTAIPPRVEYSLTPSANGSRCSFVGSPTCWRPRCPTCRRPGTATSAIGARDTPR